MKTLSIALLVSGSGTTAETVIQACQTGSLKKVLPAILISSDPRAPALAKAHALHVPTAVVRPKDYNSHEAFGDALLKILGKYRVDLVSQNGWLPWTPPHVVAPFNGNFLNQHCGAIDPGRHISPTESADFGGKNMHGPRVTTATLIYSWVARINKPTTEATVHQVTASGVYDDGRIVHVTAFKLPKI